MHLRVIRDAFEAVPGLRINNEQKFLFPVNKVHSIHSLADLIKRRIGELPAIYQGVLSGPNIKTRQGNGVREGGEETVKLEEALSFNAWQTSIY